MAGAHYRTLLMFFMFQNTTKISASCRILLLLEKTPRKEHLLVRQILSPIKQNEEILHIPRILPHFLQIHTKNIDYILQIHTKNVD